MMKGLFSSIQIWMQSYVLILDLNPDFWKEGEKHNEKLKFATEAEIIH